MVSTPALRVFKTDNRYLVARDGKEVSDFCDIINEPTDNITPISRDIWTSRDVDRFFRYKINISDVRENGLTLEGSGLYVVKTSNKGSLSNYYVNSTLPSGALAAIEHSTNRKDTEYTIGQLCHGLTYTSDSLKFMIRETRNAKPR